jgi:hypothetical protein
VKSTDPFALRHNHQVLAYGYEIHGSSFTLRLYDPNLPNRDDVTLTLSWASPPPGPISWFPPGVPVHAFFRVGNTSSEPPEV